MQELVETLNLDSNTTVAREARIMSAQGQERKGAIAISSQLNEYLNRTNQERAQKQLPAFRIIVPEKPLRTLPQANQKGRITVCGDHSFSEQILKRTLWGDSQMRRFSVGQRDPQTGLEYTIVSIPVVSGSDCLLIQMPFEEYGLLKDRYLRPGKSRFSTNRLAAPHQYPSQSQQEIIAGKTVTVETGQAALKSRKKSNECHYSIGACTTEGARLTNEDMVTYSQIEIPGLRDLIVVSVNDGMGGHEAGDIASREAAVAGINYLASLNKRANRDEWDFVLAEAKQLQAELRQNSAQLYQAGKIPDQNEIGFDDALGLTLAKRMAQAENEAVQAWEKKTGEGGGTTLSGAIILKDKAYIVNVGDSRTLVFGSNEELLKNTIDHSLVQRLVDIGQITAEEALDHPQSNVIYQFFGSGSSRPLSLEIDGLNKPDTTPSIFIAPLPPGSTIVICCDGIAGGLKEIHPGEKIAGLIGQSKNLKVEEVAAMLVRTAAQSSKDNDSVIVIRRTK